MISMVESAKRQKTPNERALEILLVGLTVLFIVVVATLSPFASYTGVKISLPVLVALLVCLIPTTIGGLLPAIGIAGMDRLIQHNVIALSGRAVEASGDVNVVLLDKTGTITLGNRMATDFIAAPGVRNEELVEAALLASLADETPEGRSIVTLAKHRLDIRGRDIQTAPAARFVPFTPELRMSGISWNGREIRKGAADAVVRFVNERGGEVHRDISRAVDDVGREGGTPLVVADSDRALGVIYLKDVLKEGIKDRLTQLRLLGIRSIMITGDNPLTAAAIAAEAGIDDFVAQARPEEKLNLIRKYQAEGNLVAMIGTRRNERRPGPGAGRCCRRNECRHAGVERGGEHGRSRLQPHEAPRHSRDRQADTYDARGSHHFQRGERCGKVFCHYTRHIRPLFPHAWHSEHNVAGYTAKLLSSRPSYSMRLSSPFSFLSH